MPLTFLGPLALLRRFYVDDSEQRNIRVYDYNADGTLSNGRIFSSDAGPPKSGVPDGMKLDRAGNLYVTGPEGICIWDRNGHHLGTIVLPEQPADLAWGGPDYGHLYITAKKSVYKLRTKAQGFVPYLKQVRGGRVRHHPSPGPIRQTERSRLGELGNCGVPDPVGIHRPHHIH